MSAVLIVIAIAGIGLPVLLWLKARHAESHPERMKARLAAHPERMHAAGAFDQWLLHRYGLSPRDRVQVQRAVLGRYAFAPLNEWVPETPGPLRPELREAARGLAELVVVGRSRTVWPARRLWRGLSPRNRWTMLAAGITIVGIAIVTVATAWGRRHLLTASSVPALAWLLLPRLYAWLLRPRLMRRSAERYLAAANPPEPRLRRIPSHGSSRLRPAPPHPGEAVRRR